MFYPGTETLWCRLLRIYERDITVLRELVERTEFTTCSDQILFDRHDELLVSVRASRRCLASLQNLLLRIS